MHPQRPPMDRRPPLALSPRRLRPRRAPPRPAPAAATRTPSTNTVKSRLPTFRASVSVESPPRLPEYHIMMSSELAALAKMAEQDFRIANTAASSPAIIPARSPLFERGRFYEMYSARRNERLKRKLWGQEGFTGGEALTQDPGVAIELSKKRGIESSKKKKNTFEEGNMVRKSLPVYCSVDRTSALRSSARITKEMKKPSAAYGAGCTTATAGRTMVTRSSLRRI